MQISAMWYDDLDRISTSARYGTYSATGNVATFDRDGLSAPARSDTVLVTTFVYNDDGTRRSVTDPMGIETRTLYDDAGRVTKTIANYVDGSPGGGTDGDQDQTIKYEYTDGLKTKVIADLPAGETDQETVYTFGVTTSDSPGASSFAAGHLLRQVQYPDSGGGGDVVRYAYSAQGQQIFTQDQAGNVLETDYDDQGRMTHRRVTTLDGDFDGSVRRTSHAYDSLGRRSTVTQYDSATVGSGSVTDEVAFTYDGWGLTTKIEQDHNSTVATGGDHLYDVDFTYEKATTGRNTFRKTGMNLPDGDALTYEYAAIGFHDGEVSRVTRVKNGATTLAQYSYNGVGRVVKTSLPEPGAVRDLAGGSAFEALDRFNRLVIDRWTKDLASDVDFYDRDITYDRGGNITVIEDNIHTGWDVAYAMDDLDRVIDADRGTWSGSSITSRTEREQWSLSQTGNWEIHKLDLDGDGSLTGANELDDDGTFNTANELTARDTDDDGTDDYTLVYDEVGNLVDDSGGYEYVYDPFGRLVEVEDQSSNTVAEYRYNGLNQRITSHFDEDGDDDVDGDDYTLHLVYDDRWRIVAEYADDESDPTIQHTHHAAGLGGRGGGLPMDNVICSDIDKNGGFTSPDGTLETRAYSCHNERGDVCARITDDGQMLEWVQYSPYGVPFAQPAGDTEGDGDADQTDLGTIIGWISSGYDVTGDLDLDGDVDAADSSLFSTTTLGRGVLSGDAEYQHFGYTGHRHDEATPILVHARHRVLHTQLGRWLRRDPLGYVDGMSLYEYIGGRVIVGNDPLGQMQIVHDQQQQQGQQQIIKNCGSDQINDCHSAIDEDNCKMCCRQYRNAGCGDKWYTQCYTSCEEEWAPPPGQGNGCSSGSQCCACLIFAEDRGHVQNAGEWTFKTMCARRRTDWNDFSGEETFCGQAEKSGAWAGGPGNPNYDACCDYLNDRNQDRLTNGDKQEIAKAQEICSQGCPEELPPEWPQYARKCETEPDWMKAQCIKVADVGGDCYWYCPKRPVPMEEYEGGLSHTPGDLGQLGPDLLHR